LGSVPGPTTWKFRHSRDGGETERKRVIDYAFVGGGGTNIAEALVTKPDEDLPRDGFPSHDFPSDHLPVGVGIGVSLE
jgi:hypothetical protein